MWEPQPLTTLRASKACMGENFTFYLFTAKILLSKELPISDTQYSNIVISNK
jgi:hypothetical protein